MLTATRLSCTRGNRPLFSGLDFDVQPGEWLHVRGANGAGKTSLLRLLAGLSPPDSGQVQWNGAPIASDREAFHRELLFIGHHAAVKDELTPRENLALAGELDGVAVDEEAVIAALRRFGLNGREDLPVRNLSAGQKRRVLLARLATRRAKLWVLDEPFTALDAPAVAMLGLVIGEHLRAGGMAVVTSHQEVPLQAGKVVQL